MVITGFDGQNAGLTINGAHLKTLLNLLKLTTLDQHQTVSKVMTKAGFPMSAEDVQAHTQSFLIIARPIDKVVHSEEESSGDPDIELEEDDRPVAKAFVM